MSLPTHPLLTLVEHNENCFLSMLNHYIVHSQSYIVATVDNQFASFRNIIETMIQSGMIGPNSDFTAFGTTSPPPTQANTDQSSAQCSHEYSNDTLTRAQEHCQNTVQQNVQLANTINTNDKIKQEFDDDEEGEEIDDDNVEKCENCEKGICTSGDAEMRENEDEHFEPQHSVRAAFENNQTTQSIISNDILPSPSPTKPINTEPLIKQECLQGSSITSIPLNFNRNASLDYISIHKPQIQTDEFDDNDYVDGDGNECNENEYLNQPNCANGVRYLYHGSNNNHLNNKVPAGEGDETNHDAAQLQVNFSVTNNTQINVQNEVENIINERSVSERIMEQSIASTSGVRSSARKQIEKNVFKDAPNSRKRKSDQSNESVKKVKHKNVVRDDEEDTDSDESMVIQQEESDANNAIGEDIATECTTNPIQPNRHLQCSHCLKSFGFRSTLQQHLRVHTGERSFQCDQCGKRFSEKSNLFKHQLIHQNIKQFLCHMCEKQFTQKHSLDVHLLRHSGERPIKCRHCAKSFTDLCTRNAHERAIHLHVKPYRCKLCGHTASQRSVVITHIRMVHFGLPRTIKQQRALNIIDDRDPGEFVEKV